MGGSSIAAAQEYWGKLIQPDNTPTELLEQLLLSIANYINKHVAPWDVPCLTPVKLAAFYKLVGGNYDQLFLDSTPSSLSFIYSSIGCFHSLQPDKDPFVPPSIPALTPQGFVKWQTVQLLLQPDEHVPFLQEAVKRFSIVHPGDGRLFPTILPRDAFPRKASDEMLKWHENALQKLRSIEEVQDVTNAPNAAEEVESLPDSSLDGHSIVDAGDYFDSHQRPRFSTTRPTSPSYAKPIVSPISTSHRPHHLKFSERPSYAEIRRNSHSGEQEFWEDSWSQDGPTPTENSKSRTSRPVRPRTPSFHSRTSSSEAADDDSFTTSEASQSPPPCKPRIPTVQHSHDSYGRRHSAHAPYDTRDYVPQIDHGRKNTLSPPFYAHQLPHSQQGMFRNIPTPPKHANVRWHDIDGGADTLHVPQSQSRPRASVRYVDDSRAYREGRMRRRSMEPADGVNRRKYVPEASGWR